MFTTEAVNVAAKEWASIYPGKAEKITELTRTALRKAHEEALKEGFTSAEIYKMHTSRELEQLRAERDDWIQIRAKQIREDSVRKAAEGAKRAFSMHDHVSVTLTKSGAEQLNAGGLFGKVYAEGDIYTASLSIMFETFGKHTALGRELFCLGGVITLERKA